MKQLGGYDKSFVRGSPDLGRSCLGGRRNLQRWYLSWSGLGIDACLMRDGVHLCWEGTVMERFKRKDRSFLRGLPS